MNVVPNKSDSITVRLVASPLFVQNNIGKPFSLIAQSSGNLVYSARTVMSEVGGFIVRFPLKDFPLGITQFTLFNEMQQPLVERLFFINKEELLKMDLTPDKEDEKYKQRGKVDLTLQVKSPQGNPLIGSFSVSVIDESKVPVK